MNNFGDGLFATLWIFGGRATRSGMPASCILPFWDAQRPMTHLLTTAIVPFTAFRRQAHGPSG